MKDYKLKLRKLRASHTLGWSWNWNTFLEAPPPWRLQQLEFLFFWSKNGVFTKLFCTEFVDVLEDQKFDTK